MDFVIGLSGLAEDGRREAYALAVGEALERLGHRVVLWALDAGPSPESPESRRLRVTVDREALPERCDVAYAQDAAAAYELHERFPTAAHAFAVHPSGRALAALPGLPGLVSVVVVMDDAAARVARASGGGAPVLRLRHPADDESRPTGEDRDGPVDHACALVEALAGVTPAVPMEDAPLREMSRLVRLWDRAEAERAATREKLGRMRADRDELERELERERARADGLEGRMAERHLRTGRARSLRRWRSARS